MRLFKKKNRSPEYINTNNVNKLQHLVHGVKGSLTIGEKSFHFHDARCFYDTYQEIVKGEIYKFNSSSENPLIIDCGANMGVSVLYFAQHYPNAKIIAFEPEDEIFNILQKNISSFNLSNVTIYKKAVWDSETTLQFFTDHGMGGSIENTFKNQQPVEVATVRLANFLQQPVEFLKLDIEGAEFTVLKDCEPYLKNVQHLFVEYHSFINKEQKLEEILEMLKENGFRYHLKQSFSQNRPFVDSLLACENMDMAINVFAYKPK